ncbi:MAG: hypothetical protein K0R08_792, partial [Solimicrobium sp.]|nr:hypothetical protein [Solimicrobium sp.]
FAPLLGISLLVNKEYHAVNIGHKEDELAAIFDALLFPPEGGQPAIISHGEFDIEEMGEELKVSSKVTGNSFTIKGTFSTLRDEWKRNIREAACSTVKKSSPKVVELHNKIILEQTIAVYQSLPEAAGDRSGLGESVIELARGIQPDILKGMNTEDIITFALKRLGKSCPSVHQKSEQVNALIQLLIQLATPPLSGMENIKNWFSNSTESRAIEGFVLAVNHLNRSNSFVFSGTPREIAAQIVDYLGLILSYSNTADMGRCNRLATDNGIIRQNPNLEGNRPPTGRSGPTGQEAPEQVNFVPY